MPGHAFSRRTFLALAGLTTASLVIGCDSTLTNPPSSSPFLNGQLGASSLILGESLGTQGLPLEGMNVHAALYYPSTSLTPSIISGKLNISKGPFPVLLYAHAYRDPSQGQNDRDFTTVGFMMNHVAEYGCVAIVPDMSWLPNEDTPLEAYNDRATILLEYYKYLGMLNSTLFANQLDLSRVILVGHSEGAGGATQAGRMLIGTGLKSLSYGLIAPASGGQSGSDIHNLLVLGGTLDIDEGANAPEAFMDGGSPKTLVTIPGANHYGYTSLCNPGNACLNQNLNDENGTISSVGQQSAGGAYLAALVRYYALQDATALPYLSGQKGVEGLDFYDPGIVVQSDGFPAVVPVPSAIRHP
jgi:hypothetical protein